MPLVDWGMIPGTTIADIALYEFSGGAADQVGQAIDRAKSKGATAIVLDLRGNPGGYAGEATKVARAVPLRRAWPTSRRTPTANARKS